MNCTQRPKSIFILGILLLFVLFLSFAGSIRLAYANTSSQPDKVNHAIIIPKQQNVDTVVAIEQPVIVEGSVTNSILAIGGNIVLRPGSYSAFVLSLGGSITQDQGATVTEGIFALGPNTKIFTTLTLAGLVSLGLYFLNASIAAVLFVTFAVGGSLIFRRDLRVSALIGRKYLRLFTTGLVITMIPALLTFASYASPRIWIATFAILLLYALLGLTGMILVTNKIGRTIVEFIGRDPGRIAALYGAIAILLLCNVPLVGFLAFVALWILGVGSMWTVMLHPELVRHVHD
ncbi:hypothetical protein [Sulfoacidibacillus thermotolerans]|uniref:Uncharacterized protein n=1 Tax=Sulfoacidibacillus thermotolerans TaxID=1765684 RepID=A0A2U3D6F2_SULT2|nr:hypothetical protein [Sulfoacidibacillus thermotolerans]PWI56858.1 hypothetical protein BM613_11505 [Sulfoacidibacillus thermotolerans]